MEPSASENSIIHRADDPAVRWLPPGESLLDRLRPRVDTRRVCLQLFLWSLVVAAGLIGNGWFALVGACVLGLVAYGLSQRSARDRRIFAQLPSVSAASPIRFEGPRPGVTLIAPARNEEAAIDEAARSLGAIDYAPLEVVIVDDHSTDDTGRILEQVQRDHPQLTILHDPPHTDGWLGKPNAVWYAVQQSNDTYEWLLFTDGDVVFHPLAAQRLIAHAETNGLDFLTCLPRLETGTLWERTVLPGMWKSLITGTPAEHLNHPDAPTVGVGACMLARREVYLRSGGHAVYPHLYLEDIALPGVIRQAGGKVGAAWTPDLLRVRLYRGWRQLREASIRKLRTPCGDDVGYALAVLCLRILPLALPLPLAFFAVLHQAIAGEFSPGVTLFALMALVTYVLAAKLHQDTEKTSDVPHATRWLHPIGGFARIWITVVTIAQMMRGSETWRRGTKVEDPANLEKRSECNPGHPHAKGTVSQ